MKHIFICSDPLLKVVRKTPAIEKRLWNWPFHCLDKQVLGEYVIEYLDELTVSETSNFE
jgi:hypothetical protein